VPNKFFFKSYGFRANYVKSKEPARIVTLRAQFQLSYISFVKQNLNEIGGGWRNMDWIHLAQDRDRWRDLVNMVKNYQISKKVKNSLTSWAITSLLFMKDSAQ
jgi:hypothetical protein